MDINKKYTPEEYFSNDQIRIDIFKSKYFTKDMKYVNDCFENIANEIGNVSIENDKKYIDIWYSKLMNGYWRSGGSIIAAVNNKTKKISTCNCSTLVIKEDNLESIYTARYEAAKMAAYRQGLGIEFSKLRPKGSKVNNSSEESEGVISWMKSFDAIAEEVGQKGRRPALLGSLKINHPDIIDFIKVKSDLKTLNNMNISIHITDDFIDAVKNNSVWKLYFETEHEKIEKEINAVELFDIICKHSYDFAEPGLQFIDKMKDGSIQEALNYEIVGTNAPVVGDSLVYTDKGLRKIKNLYELKEPIDVLVDGKQVDFYDKCYQDTFQSATFKKFENQPVYEIELENGKILQCNDEHKWLTNSSYKRTDKLTLDDKLLLTNGLFFRKVNFNNNEISDLFWKGFFFAKEYNLSTYNLHLYIDRELDYNKEEYYAGILVYIIDTNLKKKRENFSLTGYNKSLILMQDLLLSFGIYSNFYINELVIDINNLMFLYQKFSLYHKDFECLNIQNIKFDKYEESSKYVGIKGIKFTGRYEDMYCAVVPEFHGLIIDGVLSSNCSEKPLPDKGVCILASLNMENVPSVKSDKFHKFMEDECYILMRFMDNVVQYEIDNDFKSPLKDQLNVIKDLREVGLGVTNIHKWFYDNNIVYGSDESIEVIEYFFKYYQYYSFKASCILAKERGACGAWNKCKEENSFKETKFLLNLFKEFPDLKEMFYDTGIRNGAILSTAPSGSVSMTFPKDCLSSGIEPLIGYAYWRRTRAVSKNDYDYYFILPSAVKEIVLNKMKNHDLINLDDYNAINNFTGSALDQNGKIGEEIINIINKYIDTSLLKSAHEIDPFNKIRLMSKAQKWIDAAISVTYNLPENYNKDNIKDLYLTAYDNDLKSLSIYREGSREGILIFENPEKHRKKYLINNTKVMPDDIQYHLAPKREKELKCDIHHCSVNSEKWIVLVGLYNNNPYELFAGKKNEYFNISSNITEGIIIKNGKNYSLKIPYKNTYIIYDEITELFMNDQYKALTRMISLSLRHGVYYEYIIKQLKKSSDFISDFMSVVSRILLKYKSNNIIINNNSVCDNCGDILINEGGCFKCLACGYSKCE